MTPTTERKQRTITLTDRRPVKIYEDEWPTVAQANGDNFAGSDYSRRNQALQQGELDEYSVRVRQHADGRAIVYGTYSEGWYSQHNGLGAAGELLGAQADLPSAIARVGGTLGVPEQTIADCIADLPAETI